jgi:hypothetical protein
MGVAFWKIAAGEIHAVLAAAEDLFIALVVLNASFVQLAGCTAFEGTSTCPRLVT